MDRYRWNGKSSGSRQCRLSSTLPLLYHPPSCLGRHKLQRFDAHAEHTHHSALDLRRPNIQRTHSHTVRRTHHNARRTSSLHRHTPLIPHRARYVGHSSQRSLLLLVLYRSYTSSYMVPCRLNSPRRSSRARRHSSPSHRGRHEGHTPCSGMQLDQSKCPLAQSEQHRLADRRRYSYHNYIRPSHRSTHRRQRSIARSLYRPGSELHLGQYKSGSHMHRHP
jgi:hypothetical protein